MPNPSSILLALASLCLAACASTSSSGDAAATDPTGAGSLLPPELSAVALGLDSAGASLRGLSVPSPGVIWTSGSSGTILRSADGGASWGHVGTRAATSSWSSSATPAELAELDFRMLWAFDASEAWAASAGSGAASRLFHTTDAGRTWDEVLVNEDPEGFWDGLAFWDRSAGMLIGDPTWSEDAGRRVLTVLITEDGGATWDRVGAALPELAEAVSRKTELVLDEYCFAASNRSIALEPGGRAWLGTGGAAARVLRTADMGRSWDAVDSGLGQSDAAAGVFAVDVIDRSGLRPIVFAVGGAYDVPDAAAQTGAWSFDGGSTWQLPEAGPGGYRSAVVCGVSPRPVILAADTTSTVVRGTPPRPFALAAGTTGLSLTVGPEFTGWTDRQTAALNAISLAPGTGTVWAVGPNGDVWTGDMRSVFGAE